VEVCDVGLVQVAAIRVTVLRIRCGRLMEPGADALRAEHLDSILTLPNAGEVVRLAAMPCSCGADSVVAVDFRATSVPDALKSPVPDTDTPDFHQESSP
jgi:hypothetical protein